MQKENVKDLVRSIIDGSASDMIAYSEIVNKLPYAYQDKELVEEVVCDLYKEGSVVPYGNMYIKKLEKDLYDLVDSIPKGKTKNIFVEKLCGMKTKDIIAKYNVTRQYVHSCIDDLLDKYHTRKMEEEISYASAFKKYNFKKESFMATYEVPGEVYELLALIYKPNKLKRLPLEEILESDELEDFEKENLINYFHRADVKIDGEYVTMKHDEIVDFIITHYCKQPTSVEEFDNIYNHILKKCPVGVRKELSVFDNSKNYITNRKDVLWISSTHFRYYPIQHEDLMKLYDNVNFYKYNNQIISATKIFNDYRLLMREIDIKDGKELHALLKRTFDDYGPNMMCTFSRNPTIIFGNRVLEDQLEDLVEANSPIRKKDLVNLIVDKYGFDKGTVVASYLSLLRKYYIDGVYCSNKDVNTSDEDIA